jgi:putative transcriptional regulator
VVKSITDISVCAAIAESALTVDQPVGLAMKDGLLWATSRAGEGARGVTCNAAAPGEDVGIRDIEGLVSLVPGKLTLVTVPPVQKGGSRRVDLKRLKKQLEGKEPVCALGIEALVALRKVKTGAIGVFGSPDSVIEAAQHGLNPLIVCVENEIAGLIKRLEDNRLEYSVIDLRIGPGLDKS